MSEFDIKDNTLQLHVHNFSLERSCTCGQAFRWVKRDNGSFCCVIGKELVSVSQHRDTLCISPCSDTDATKYVTYFDLDRDYNAIEDKMLADAVLKKCIPYASGIRVFAQEPFETLISFIISANNNIKRISTTIERLCKACGEKMTAKDGTEYYLFPTAEALKNMPLTSLRELGLGYRDEYIKSTAECIAEGFPLESLRDMPYTQAKKELCKLRGVGGKVADCVLLFSLGHGRAFPMDVWMKRAMSSMFFEGKEPKNAELCELLDGFGDDAGRIQQYIFHFARETGLKNE